MAFFELIMKWAGAHPYLATTLCLGTIAGGTAIGCKGMEALQKYGENGTPLFTVNSPDTENKLS